MTDKPLSSDFNSTIANPDNYDKTSYIPEWIIISLYFITVIMGVFGNTIVCKIVFFTKHMRTRTNILIANMAISDLLCATAIPGQWVFCYKTLIEDSLCFEILCSINSFFQFHSFWVSSLSVTAIAIDRYIVVKNPLHRKNYLRYYILITWLFPAIFILLTEASIRISTYSFTDSKIIGCKIILRFQYPFNSGIIRYIRATGFFLFQYLIPLTVSAILYVIIMKRIWKRDAGEMLDTQRNAFNSIKLRTIKMLLIMVLVFAVFWLPFYASVLYTFYVKVDSPDKCDFSFSYQLCFWIGISICSVNPFIYWWFNDEFRAACRKFWIFLKCKRRQRTGSNDSRDTLMSIRTIHIIDSNNA